MSIKLAVFDMAGTTVQDDNNVAQAFKEAFESQGIDTSSININHLMGYKKTVAIATVLERLSIHRDEQLITQLHEVFMQQMLLHYQTATNLQPLPHAEDVFKALRVAGVSIALNTGFSKNIADVIISRLAWGSLINEYIASDEVPDGRPAPFMIRELMSRTRVKDATEVIKIGDTDVDILEGRNSGCRLVVAVTTGAYTRDELTKSDPDFIIDGLHELMPLIEQVG